MKIAVLGATGLTGKHLVEQGLARGHEVTAVVRRAADMTTPAHPKLTIVEAQATQQGDMERVLAGHDAVLSAIGSRTRAKNSVRTDSARAIVGAMQALGIKRLIWMCAAGVGDSADQARRSSFVFGRIFMPLFLKHVYADAADADELIARSGLDWVVVRPVGLHDRNDGDEIAVVPSDQKLPRMTISRLNVAKFMLDQVSSRSHVQSMPAIC